MFPEILLLVVLIVLSAFFNLSETALISLNDSKIKSMPEEQNGKGRLLKKLLEEPGRFLATIQIGVAFSYFLVSAFVAEHFAEKFVGLIKMTNISVADIWLKNISIIIISLVLLYFTLVLGEMVPKKLAVRKAEAVSRFVAGPLYFFSIFAYPFIKILTMTTGFLVRLFGVDPNEDDEKVTEEEIRLMVDVGEEKGTIDETEKEMINNIFDFNNKVVSDIMTHRTEIEALPVDARLNEVTSFINSEKYSRIPVYEDNIDNIIGIMHAKYIIQYLAEEGDKKSFNLKDIIRHPYFVPSSKKTDELLKELQRNKTHMAIVIDEYGGTAGIVTLEDLIEEIVGNIFDEDDVEEKEMEKIDDNTYLINGAVSLDEVQEALGVDLPVDDYETLSGFVIGQMGRIPEKGDTSTIEFNDLMLKVEEVDEKKVSKIRVCKNGSCQ
ncbi:hemolysin family protein [Pseudobacteroides cellulosolvens]|uniref:Putative signal transduction protein with CBS domain containing protein n=1 Tax=Pseudobacteroides cellulosolvens ATCC 35603 = DSM 2933 TaxID=398512 RepID=A0A0L6JJZ1_9FIRM|nr:hemolysin family protein [Pseudobacteroides cellulosolvens]KNY26028.1 putative signal transduction protein with CBS domain containing protein [Pseudobacteroides cellulosolvens ATCC 35603 = DSM 2933]